MTEATDPDIAELSKLLEGFVAAPIDAALRDHLSKKPDWFDDERDRLLSGQSDVGAEVEALTKLTKRVSRDLSDAIAEQDRKLGEIGSLVDALAVAEAVRRDEGRAAYAAVVQNGLALREAVATVRRRQAFLGPSIGIAVVLVIEIIHHLQ